MSTNKIFNRKNLLYALYVFVLLVIGLEVFGRIYLTCILKKSVNPKFTFDYFRVYKHRPGFTEGDKNGNWIVINKQGFRRNTDVSKIKPANTFRIFLMGGSAAHGISSSPPNPIINIYLNQTIDAYLEVLLKKKYPDKNFEVINAAVTGYQCFQHTAYLLGEIIDYHPDMVFFLDGINDHFIDNVNYDYYSDNRYLFWRSRLEDPSISGMKDYFMLWLSKYSAFARGYYAWKLTSDAYDKKIAYPENMTFADDSERIKAQSIAAQKGYLRAVETNIQILKANNIIPVVTLQPIEILRSPELLSPEENNYLDKSLERIKPVYPVVVDQLKNITSKYQVTFEDFNPAFSNTEYAHQQLFLDYCHLTPLGGELVAKTIFPVVDSLYNESLQKTIH